MIRLLLHHIPVLIIFLLLDSTRGVWKEQAEHVQFVRAEVRLLDLLELLEVDRIMLKSLSLGHLAELLVVKDG